MRVRYGKPIKVKSLLGQSNIPFYHTAANVTFYPLTTGTFYSYADPSVLNIKYVNRQANHKYFLFLNTDIVYSWSYFGIWDTYNTGYEGNRTAPIKDGNNYYTLISPTTSATNGVPTFQFGVTQNFPAIANYALIIDLTEIGLDNLTAQEFYNKYHQYFHLIATGEEITIDDKAGQVSLKEKNSNNTISCKVAGGSSDIYYGYNQILNRSTFTSNGITWALNADSTFTLSGTATSTYSSFGLNGILKKNHKYLNILQILENPNNISMGSGFFNMGQKNPKISSGFSGAISLYSYDSSYDSMGIDQYGGVGVDLTGIKIRFQIIDLTWWYGENKEPSTYNEFKEKFAKEYYGLCSTPIKLTRYQIEALPSYGYNQLLNNPTFVLSCTTSQVSGKAVGTVDFVANNKYLIRCYQDKTMTSNTRNTFLVYLNGSPTYENPAENYNLNSGNRGWIYTPSESGTGDIQLWAHTPSVAVNYSDFQVINLTDWYGAGNEPTTIEEFKATFPNKYYPYSKKRLLNKYMINKLIN